MWRNYKYVCHYQEKTFFMFSLWVNKYMSLSGKDTFYVFFSVLISCLSFQMNINPPKMTFKITGQGHKILNHSISQNIRVFSIFLCVWGTEFVRKKAFGILRSWLCLVSMWNANFPCEYFIFVPLKFVRFKKGVNFRCLSICLGYSRMAAVVVFNTDWRIQLASFSQRC